jgi:hypothetical protein
VRAGIGRHTRLGGLAQAWRGFRRWRRSRPFWGGLFLILAGSEIFSTTQASLAGLTFQMGPTGFLSWLIPTILFACGLLAWFTPQQRMFYAIVGGVTALYSLIGVNLGGFFIGLLLGIVGAALVFAWTPTPPAVRQPAAEAASEPSYDQPPEPQPATTVDELRNGPPTETLPQPRTPEPGEVEQETDAEPRPRRIPPAYVITLVVLSLAVTGMLVGARGSAHAEPCPSERPAGSLTASPAPTPAPSDPNGSPSPVPTDQMTSTSAPQVVASGAAGLSSPLPSASSAEPTPSVTLSTAPGTPSPTACSSPRPTPSRTARPARPATAGEVDRIAADPGQPQAASAPSHLTGSRLTMFGLHLEGVVDLPTAEGTLRVVKFTMGKATTDDFALRIGGPDKPLLIRSGLLTVDGDVSFYATRFEGSILGVKLTLTPESPVPPDGVDLSLPVIMFDDPDVQLAFVDCTVLTASPLAESFA